jgi:transposase InsO family protein
MPTPVVGQFYYLYMIEDIYSRKIVRAEVYEQESGEDAAALLEHSLLKEKMSGQYLTVLNKASE